MTTAGAPEPDVGPAPPAGFEDRATFVLGLAKSGTTLLQSLLDGHPQLLVDAAESKFLSHWWPRARALDADARIELGVEVMLREFGADSINGSYLDHLSGERVVERYRALVHRSTLDEPQRYLLAALVAYGHESGQVTPRLRRWVEKTPVRDDVFPALRSWWPDARALRVIRDPRANFVAEHRLRRYVTASDFADRWLAQLGAVRQAQLDPAQMVIRYEDLAADPAGVMNRVARFLDIDPHECLAQPTKAGGHRSYRGNSSTGAAFSGVSAERTERWRTEASKTEVAVIEAITGPALEEFGYEPIVSASVRRTLGPALRAWRRRIRPAVGTARRSVRRR